LFPSDANDKRAAQTEARLQSVEEIQAPDLSNGTIVAMRLQKSHYLGAETVVIDRQAAYVV
jgi:hypothetical protein